MENKKEVALIGLGIGNLNTVTGEGIEALHKAQCIIGAARLLESLTDFNAEKTDCITPIGIKDIIDQSSHTYFAVVFSGDIGFYSGAKKLSQLLKDCILKPIPGLSTPIYFAAQLLRPWENFHFVSGHGKVCYPVKEVSSHKETFFLTDKAFSPDQLCKSLEAEGLGDLKVSIGEALSYENQKISSGKVKDFTATSFSSPNVVLVDNPSLKGQKSLGIGLPDKLFFRGKVPMTKAEVRSVILSKLRLKQGHTVYDIGAGTGSVTVEIALQTSLGKVYAIERNPEGATLINQNIQQFSLNNVEVIVGEAPKALLGLPPPDRLFLGGTGHQLESILLVALEKNPDLLWVATCVTLNTLATFITLKEKLSVQEFQVVQLSVTKYPQRGSYLMADAENPIFIISGRGQG